LGVAGILGIERIMKYTSTPLVPFTGIIGRRPINARDFAAHRPNVRAQLSAMVNDIEQRNPQQPTHRVFERKFALWDCRR
jgi:hypothetical protein